MYCTKCGTENSDEAVYCQKCGRQFDGEVETRVAPRSVGVSDAAANGEHFFAIRPTLIFVKLGYAVAVIGAFLIVALFSWLLPLVSPWISVLIGMLLLLVPAWYHFMQKLTKYTLTDTTIEIDRGLVSRTTQNIPLRRVQDVTVNSTIFQRIFRFGDILIDNASEDGGKVVLKNIDSPRKYADIMLRQMRQLDR